MKIYQLGIIFVYLMTLSACVTQQLVDENNKQIIQSEATQNDIALTRISLGLGYLEIGDTTQAKFNLEKARLLSPKLIEAHTAFAYYYEVVGEIDLAIQSYEKAIVIDEENPDTLNNYGAFLCKQGELVKAERQFLKAIAIPTYLQVAESYENLSWCHLHSNNFVEAEFYLEKAILHSPKRTSSLLQMAHLHYAKGDFEKAIQLMKRHDTAKRRYTPSSLALSYRIQYKLKDRQKAKGYANILLSTFASSNEAKQYLDNGLIHSEGDKLAERYKKHQRKIKPKRVVKLAPKKTTVVNQPISSNKSDVQKVITAKKETKKIVNTYPLVKENDAIKVSNIIESERKQVPVSQPTKVVKAVVSTTSSTVEQTISTKAVTNAKAVPTARIISPAKVVSTNNVKPVEEDHGFVEYDLSFEDDHNLTDYLDSPEDDVNIIEKTTEVASKADEVNHLVKTATNSVASNDSVSISHVSNTAEERKNDTSSHLTEYANNFEDENDLIEYSTNVEPESDLSEFANNFEDQFTGYETNESITHTDVEETPEQVELSQPVKVAQAHVQTYTNETEGSKVKGNDSSLTKEINNVSVEDDPNEYDNYFDTENELFDYSTNGAEDTATFIQNKSQTAIQQNNSALKVITNIPSYTINKGDSLFRISKEHKVSITSLLDWNRLESAELIKEGDVIYLADPKLSNR